MVSTENVENVVKEPINPVPKIKVYAGFIVFLRLTNVKNHPRIKQPIRLTESVANGNPFSVYSHSPTENLQIVPKNPPIITNNKDIGNHQSKRLY